MRLGLPAPLFTIDFEGTANYPLGIPPDRLKRFFDNLEPAFGLQVSLGQTNTLVLCPALTSHSELSEAALAEAGITRSTMRISVGDEDPRYLIEHLKRTASFAFGDLYPDFGTGFPPSEVIDTLYERTYLEVHGKWVRERIGAQ